METESGSVHHTCYHITGSKEMVNRNVHREQLITKLQLSPGTSAFLDGKFPDGKTCEISACPFIKFCHQHHSTTTLTRYDNVTLIPLVLHLVVRIDLIQRMGAN